MWRRRQTHTMIGGPASRNAPFSDLREAHARARAPPLGTSRRRRRDAAGRSGRLRGPPTIERDQRDRGAPQIDPARPPVRNSLQIVYCDWRREGRRRAVRRASWSAATRIWNTGGRNCRTAAGVDTARGGEARNTKSEDPIAKTPESLQMIVARRWQCGEMPQLKERPRTPQSVTVL